MERRNGNCMKMKQNKCEGGTMSKNENALCQISSESRRIGHHNIVRSRQTAGMLANTTKSSQCSKILGERNCKLIPVVEKVDSKLVLCIKTVISGSPALNVNSVENKENFSCTLTYKNCLQNLRKEADKMKANKAMSLIPLDLIVKLFSVLQKNIDEGAELLLHAVTEGSGKPKSCQEKLVIAADSALIILFILTSPEMPRNIFTEVVFKQIEVLLKYHFEVLLSTGSTAKTNKSKKFLNSTLHIKLEKILIMFLELVSNDSFIPETIVQRIISLSVRACCFCASMELSQNLFRLLGKIFAKYEHVKLQILDNILAAKMDISSRRKCVCKYELQSGEYIQMSSALVLYCIQCDLSLPEFSRYSSESDVSIKSDILKRFEEVTQTATYFVSSLMDACAVNVDCNLGVLEEFVKDLLVMSSKPQWPGVELILNTLGKLLLSKLPETVAASYRTLSIHVLGQITVGLKKNAAVLQLAPETEKQICTLLPHGQLNVDGNNKYIFQKLLLSYLSTSTLYDHARFFHLAEWYRDEVNLSNASNAKNEGCSEGNSKHKCSAPKRKKVSKVTVDQRQFLISQMKQESHIQMFEMCDKDVESVCWALSFLRSYSDSSSMFLNHIISLLTDASSAIRTRVIKCVMQILEGDSNILQDKDFLSIIKIYFHDQSVHVRESVLDLVEKLIVHHPEIIGELYDLLMARIVDTSISVRKQVIKILNAICSHNLYPSKVPDMCLKMVKRIKDDESVKKLVVKVFQDMWFTPTDLKECMSHRIITITSIVRMSDSHGLSCLKELFDSISIPQLKAVSSDTKLNAPATGCEHLIGTFVEIIEVGSAEKQFLLHCVTTLNVLSQVWPQLVAMHVGVLRTLLCQKCCVPEDFQMTSIIINILTQVVPFLKTSGDFLVQLETDIENLVMNNNSLVIESCILCLASIVNVTQNFEPVHKYFNRYYTFLSKNFECTLNQPLDPRLKKCNMFLKTALFIIGLLFKHFDFTDSGFERCSFEVVKNRLFELLLHFILQKDLALQRCALKTIGLFCTQCSEFVVNSDLKKFYKEFLKDEMTDVSIRVQILKNMEMYLLKEESRLLRDTSGVNSAKSKYGNIKDIGDAHSGLATSVIQYLLPEILNSFLCFDRGVRSIMLNIVQLVLRQGLVYRPQVLAHVIAMTTDCDSFIRCTAEQLLKDAGKHISALQSKFQSGIYLSFSLQNIVQEQRIDNIVRGFLIMDNVPVAVNNCLYLLVRPSQLNRNRFLSVLIKNFDDTANRSLSEMLYLADNLAHFSYSLQNEVLFLLNNITAVLSVFCASLIKFFNEKVRLGQIVSTSASEVEASKEVIALHVTQKKKILQEFIHASQGCILLFLLKEHLQQIYGLNDDKLLQYSISVSAKSYDKALHKMGNSIFQPVPVIEKLKHMDIQNTSRDDLVQQVVYIKSILVHELGVEKKSNESFSSENVQHNTFHTAETNCESKTGTSCLIETEIINEIEVASAGGLDCSKKFQSGNRKSLQQKTDVYVEEECERIRSPVPAVSISHRRVPKVVRTVDRTWRRERGLPEHANSYGPLTNLPDYSFKDGRPVPLGVGQYRRLLKQRELAEKVMKFTKEMDFAVERHEKLQQAEEDRRQHILSSKLKPKGDKLLKDG